MMVIHYVPGLAVGYRREEHRFDHEGENDCPRRSQRGRGERGSARSIATGVYCGPVFRCLSVTLDWYAQTCLLRKCPRE
jgi:hypothetical protein